MKRALYIYYFFLIILALLVRIIWLDSDPPILLSYGSIGDEGLWVHNARLWVLFGSRTIDDFSHDYAIAPLFSWVVEASFRLLGVNFVAARLPSALFGFLAVLLSADMIRRVASGKLQKIALLFIVIHTPLLIHSRLAVGESLTIFFLIACWWLWLYGANRFASLASGAMLGLAILAKLTSIQYAAVFAVLCGISWFAYRERTKVKAFMTGFFIVAVAAAAYWWTERESIITILATFARVYSWANVSSATALVSQLVFHPFWGSPFFVGVVWLCANRAASHIGQLLRLGRSWFMSSDPLIVSSLVWVTVGIIPLLFGANHPSTRFYAFVLPMVVLALSKTTLREGVVPRLVQQLRVPAALFLISLAGSKILLAFARRTVISDELREQMFWPAFLVLLLIALLSVYVKRSLATFVAKQTGVIWRWALGLTLLSIFWNYVAGFVSLSLGARYLLVAATATTLWLSRRYMTREAVFGVHVVISMISLHMLFSQPSFTIRDASRELGNKTYRGEYTTGFLAHELSIENATYPIYWGPRQPFVGNLNEEFARKVPTVLLVPTYLEASVPLINSWPGLADYPEHALYQIGSLRWHRRWGFIERQVELSVYRMSPHSRARLTTVVPFGISH